MEVHQLRYFLAVAKTGSFREASAQCHISQPALSEQIQKLESEVEAALFFRNHRGVIPTPAGRVLAERAALILEQIERAKKAVKIRADTSERIQIGTIPTIAPFLLAHAMGRFRQKYPSPQLIVHEDAAPRIIEMLEDDDLEMGIVSLPLKDQGFVAEELFTEELLLAVPVRHPLVSKPIVRAEDLVLEKFILLSDDHCLSRQVFVFFDEHELRPQVAFKSSQLETVQSFVMAGEGVAFVPEMAKCTGPLVYRPIEQGPKRTIVAIRKTQAGSAEAIKEFLGLLRELATTQLSTAKG